MKRFDFFIVSGLVFSLLSGSSSVGFCTGCSSSDIDNSGTSKFAYINKVSEKNLNKGESKENKGLSTVGKVVLGGVGLAAAGAAGYGGLKLYDNIKRKHVKLYNYESLLLDQSGTPLRVFNSNSELRDFLSNNSFNSEEIRFPDLVKRVTSDSMSDKEWQNMYGRYFSKENPKYGWGFEDLKLDYKEASKLLSKLLMEKGWQKALS